MKRMLNIIISIVLCVGLSPIYMGTAAKAEGVLSFTEQTVSIEKGQIHAFQVTLDSKAIAAENAVYTVAKPDGSANDLSAGTLFAANTLTVDAAEKNTSLKITANVLIDKTQYKADLIISLTEPAKNVTSISITAEKGEITVSDTVQTIKITSSYGPADAKAPVLSYTMARDDKAAFAKDTAIDPVTGTVTIDTSEKAGTITVTAADAADDLQAETAISVKEKAQPTSTPAAVPTASPTAVPTASPTPEPTASPSASPKVQMKMMLSKKIAASKIYTIKTEADLKQFADSVNEGNDYAGETVSLANDIVLTNEWTPIGKAVTGNGTLTSGYVFKGIFEGGSHTISGLTISEANSSYAENDTVGLFGTVDGGSIENLKLTNVSVSAPNCKKVGAICGHLYGGGTINNCEVYGSVSGYAAGGIAGYMQIDGTISKCVNHAAVTGTKGLSSAAGGIVAKAYFTMIGKETNILSCTNYGTITADYDLGGIVGLSCANIRYCSNYGTVSMTISNMAGGIAGEQKTYGEVIGNLNAADISGGITGGIIGWIRSITSEYDVYQNRRVVAVKDNTNTGTISGKGQLGSGGIVGEIYNAATVTGNANSAQSITGYAFAGGIVGGLQATEKCEYYKSDTNTILVQYNYSLTDLSNITVLSGICKDVYAYNNDVKFIVSDNTASSIAAIGSKEYGTLTEAVSASKSGDTIKILKDINCPETSAYIVLQLKENTIFDLQGHTINVPNSNGIGTLVFEGSSCVIRNGKFTGNNSNGTKANYCLWIGDEDETDGITIDSVVTESGINIFHADNVVLKNVTATAGPKFYTVWLDETASASIESGTYTGVSANSVLVWNKETSEDGTQDTVPSKLTIDGGSFIGGIGLDGDSAKGSLLVSGGYYTQDPSAYLASGYALQTSDSKEYPYLVGKISSKIQTSSGKTTVNEIKVPAGSTAMSHTAKEDLKKIAAAIQPDASDTALSKAAAAIADNQSALPTVDEAKQALEDSNISTLNQNINVVVKTRLEVTPEYFDTEKNEITLDIKPLAEVYATTSDADGMTDANSAKISTSRLEISDGTPVVISAEIPSSMAIADGTGYQPLTIKHVKDNGAIYYYTAAVKKENGKYYAVFTVMHGFSQFVLMPENRKTAKITFDTDPSTSLIYAITNVSDALPKAAAKDGYVFDGWKFDGVDGLYTTMSNDLFAALTADGSSILSASAQYTEIKKRGFIRKNGLIS